MGVSTYYVWHTFQTNEANSNVYPFSSEIAFVWCEQNPNLYIPGFIGAGAL